MKVAVIGCGSWGRNLVRVFYELGALAALCDNRPGVLADMAKRYPGVRLVSDVEAILCAPALETVAIATPALSHYRLARAALLAGKHTFVEKPLALCSTEAETLIALAETGGRTLMVGHVLRYHAAIVKLKELCEQGELGRLEYAYANRLNLGKVRREENALWSFAPHDVSILLHLFAAMPVQVSAVGGAYLQPHIADVSVSNLLFPGGARAHIFVSWLHPFREQKLVVVGTKRMAVFDALAPTYPLQLYDKGIELVNGDFLTQPPEAVPVPLEMHEPLRHECQHFLACAQMGTRPVTDGAEGLRVLRVLQACHESLQRHGEPVQIEGVDEAGRYG
jgi:UDP-2-acetamido-3-amino-2,3-dideoxy-glucuronate N-acetyltransferase